MIKEGYFENIIVLLFQVLELDLYLVHWSLDTRGIHPWNSNCSHTPFWALPFLRPWVFSALWWPFYFSSPSKLSNIHNQIPIVLVRHCHDSVNVLRSFYPWAKGPTAVYGTREFMRSLGRPDDTGPWGSDGVTMDKLFN